MRQVLACVSGLLAILLLVAIVQAAPPNQVAQPVSAAPTLAQLQQRILNLAQERQNALQDLNARYQSAPLADRVALEAEGAQLVERYERGYLELLVQYHRLSGNQEELTRAQQMLENLNTVPPKRTPLNPEHNRPTESPAAQPEEGGVINAQ